MTSPKLFSALLLNVSESIRLLVVISFHYSAYKLVWEKKKEGYPRESDDGPIDYKEKDVLQLDQLLELTMDWNCIDVAKEFALENSLRYIKVDTLI